MTHLLFRRFGVKLASLAAFGVASVIAAQAQSDMLLGFNDAGANVNSATYQNDYVIDMGAISSFTATSTFSTNISQTTFHNAFSSDSSYLNDVAVGVVAENNDVVPKQIYVSSTSTPGSIPTTLVNNIIADASGIVSGEYTMAAGGSSFTGWSYNVGVAPGDPGTLDSNPLGDGDEVEAQGIAGEETFLSSGDATINLYEATSSGTSHAFTEIGTFTINANNGVDTISYAGISVSSGAPSAGTVTASVTNGFSPLTVIFTNSSSSGSITNWVWNFGNGTIITNTTAANVTNTYSASGSYTVTLTVYGPGGTNSYTATNYIMALPKPKLGSLTVSAGKLIFSGTNCPAGVQYRILSSTNVATTLANWTPVYTNTFASNGSFSYTNGIDTTNSYFIMISP